VKSKNCGVFQDGRFRFGYPSLSRGRRIIRGRNPGQECDIYKRRETESAYTAYEILIVRHLVPNDTKFKEYLRLSQELFHYVLNFVKEDIALKLSNRIKKPISPEQKLCIFLR
jgi:hypothetical protein